MVRTNEEIAREAKRRVDKKSKPYCGTIDCGLGFSFTWYRSGDEIHGSLALHGALIPKANGWYRTNSPEEAKRSAIAIHTPATCIYEQYSDALGTWFTVYVDGRLRRDQLREGDPVLNDYRERARFNGHIHEYSEN